MIRKLALFGLVGLGLAACQSGITTTSSSYAVDTNGDGVVDCDDLDRVHMCLHFQDAETAELCAHADVSKDGIIDDEDIHGMYNGITARGYQCAAPPVHDTCGTDCDIQPWVLQLQQENEYEHEYENEAGCEDGDCPGLQNRFRKRCRCRYRGCEGDDCPNCPEDCGCGNGDPEDPEGQDDPPEGQDDPPEGQDDPPEGDPPEVL